ncbi:uncharacterized protein ASCRUDRAFT_74181 [Ascoidea rubescens DSM 1968]|uniref:Uncharacterized protein n=1 Tax=Ascoidea rubescens DSM 1968 TaxID=1344418 RepID=A0A1D2VM61_9ASCO|nr:hypothetical protein ASCRUDRAFT_74181 [Ascoidea rubescens DSM 1968]ODV62698.1 hypothetical protein ASCRUDRAFT_74181 [Ascoidea rubescens DSM 1968]
MKVKTFKHANTPTRNVVYAGLNPNSSSISNKSSLPSIDKYIPTSIIAQIEEQSLKNDFDDITSRNTKLNSLTSNSNSFQPNIANNTSSGTKNNTIINENISRKASPSRNKKPYNMNYNLNHYRQSYSSNPLDAAKAAASAINNSGSSLRSYSLNSTSPYYNQFDFDSPASFVQNHSNNQVKLHRLNQLTSLSSLPSSNHNNIQNNLIRPNYSLSNRRSQSLLNYPLSSVNQNHPNHQHYQTNLITPQNSQLKLKSPIKNNNSKKKHSIDNLPLSNNPKMNSNISSLNTSLTNSLNNFSNIIKTSTTQKGNITIKKTKIFDPNGNLRKISIKSIKKLNGYDIIKSNSIEIPNPTLNTNPNMNANTNSNSNIQNNNNQNIDIWKDFETLNEEPDSDLEFDIDYNFNQELNNFQNNLETNHNTNTLSNTLPNKPKIKINTQLNNKISQELFSSHTTQSQSQSPNKQFNPNPSNNNLEDSEPFSFEDKSGSIDDNINNNNVLIINGKFDNKITKKTVAKTDNKINTKTKLDLFNIQTSHQKNDPNPSSNLVIDNYLGQIPSNIIEIDNNSSLVETEPLNLNRTSVPNFNSIYKNTDNDYKFISFSGPRKLKSTPLLTPISQNLPTILNTKRSTPSLIANDDIPARSINRLPEVQMHRRTSSKLSSAASNLPSPSPIHDSNNIFNLSNGRINPNMNIDLLKTPQSKYDDCSIPVHTTPPTSESNCSSPRKKIYSVNFAQGVQYINNDTNDNDKSVKDGNKTKRPSDYSEAELYAKALEVAKERVYGNSSHENSNLVLQKPQTRRFNSGGIRKFNDSDRSFSLRSDSSKDKNKLRTMSLTSSLFGQNSKISTNNRNHSILSLDSQLLNKSQFNKRNLSNNSESDLENSLSAQKTYSGTLKAFVSHSLRNNDLENNSNHLSQENITKIVDDEIMSKKEKKRQRKYLEEKIKLSQMSLKEEIAKVQQNAPKKVSSNDKNVSKNSNNKNKHTFKRFSIHSSSNNKSKNHKSTKKDEHKSNKNINISSNKSPTKPDNNDNNQNLMKESVVSTSEPIHANNHKASKLKKLFSKF